MNPPYCIPLDFQNGLDHNRLGRHMNDWVPHNDHKDRQNDTLTIHPRWIRWLDLDDRSHLCQELALGCRFAPNQYHQKQDVAA